MKSTEPFAPISQKAITLRVVLAAALSLTFVVALRWASDVTQANARRISHNLQTVSERMDGRNSPTKFSPPLLQEAP